MNEVKFIDYKLTPGEKHLGIVTILINNLIYLRYKMTPGKNGGAFPNMASYKISEHGVESYQPAVVVESRMLEEQIKECIKKHTSSNPYPQSSGAPTAADYGNPYRASPPVADSQTLGDCPF